MRLKTLKLVSLFVASLWLSAALAAQQIDEVVLTIGEKGKPYASVDIDRKATHPFLLDTAAQNTVILERLVEAMKLSIYDNKRRLSTTGHGTKEVKAYRVGDLYMGRVHMPKEWAIALKGSKEGPHMGIIGGSLWAGVAAEFNLDAKRLRIYHKGEEFDETEWTRIKGKLIKKRFLVIPIEIENRKMQALIDTGANRTIINVSASKKLDLVRKQRLFGSSTIKDGSGSVRKVSRFRANPVLLGGHPVRAIEIYTTDLAIFNSLNLDSEPTVILGMDVLQNFNFAIDLSEKSFYVKPRKGSYSIYR